MASQNKTREARFLIDQFHQGFSSTSMSTIVCSSKSSFLFPFSPQKKENKTFAFGKNDSGHLGIGTVTMFESKPKHLDFFKPDDISAIAMGSDHCLVLCSSNRNGRLFSWGHNKFGQVGNGESGENVIRPVEIISDQMVAMIACGEDFSMCLTCEGAVFTWGENICGQLGHGNTDMVSKPEKVLALAEDIRGIACQNCTSFAWSGDTLYTWGSRAGYDIGKHARMSDVLIPISLPQFKVRAIVCGGEHSYCVTDDRKLYCWGLSVFGQLGIRLDFQFSVIRKEFLIEQSYQLISIASGEDHAIFWTSEGLFSIGLNESGQLGVNLGQKISSKTLQKIDFFSNKKILAIGAGAYHSYCLTDEGLYAWGSSRYGQLANTLSVNSVPFKIEFSE